MTSSLETLQVPSDDIFNTRFSDCVHLRFWEIFIEALNILYEISGQWSCLNNGYHRYNYCRTADIWKWVVAHLIQVSNNLRALTSSSSDAQWFYNLIKLSKSAPWLGAGKGSLQSIFWPNGLGEKIGNLLYPQYLSFSSDNFYQFNAAVIVKMKRNIFHTALTER